MFLGHGIFCAVKTVEDELSEEGIPHLSFDIVVRFFLVVCQIHVAAPAAFFTKLRWLLSHLMIQ